jgi:hypothetical protein
MRKVSREEAAKINTFDIPDLTGSYLSVFKKISFIKLPAEEMLVKILCPISYYAHEFKDGPALVFIKYKYCDIKRNTINEGIVIDASTSQASAFLKTCIYIEYSAILVIDKKNITDDDHCFLLESEIITPFELLDTTKKTKLEYSDDIKKQHQNNNIAYSNISLYLPHFVMGLLAFIIISAVIF